MTSVPDRNHETPALPATRRSVLQLGLAGAGAVAVGPALVRMGLLGGTPGAVEQGGVAGVISGKAPMKGPRVRKFERELVILEARPGGIARPYRTATEVFGGKEHAVHYYQLKQRKETADLLPAPFPRTEIWGYDGMYPGPLFRQQQNGPYIVIENENQLDLGHPTSTHLHGSPTQPAHDGHPDDETYPAATAVPPLSKYVDDGVTPAYRPTHVYRYPNAQECRTLWYHDHGIHRTAEQVYKGLVGVYIQEPDEEALKRAPGLADLPTGTYDVSLVVADMQFDTRGRVAYDDKGHDSLWGNVLLVNGRAWPKMTVDATRYRFRVLVADLSRGYNFALGTPSKGSPAPTMTMIGTDAGMLARTVPLTEWRQGMAERYEVVIDFSGLKAGETVTLLNTAASGDMGQVMQFVGSGVAVPSKPVPASLNDYDFEKEEKRVVNATTPRYFRFDRKNGLWSINSLPWDGRIAADPRIGTSELWVLENASGGWFHPIHIHLVDFAVLRRNGQPVPEWERGWKDVVYLGPEERVELVMRFDAAAQMDPDTVPPAERKPVTGKYVMHCHNLVHEDHDMMAQFQTRQESSGPGSGMPAGHDGRAGAVRADLQHPSMMVQWRLQA